ncbi:MAG: Ig-like domain-containing protein [Armatimonadota bacterium]
MRIIKQAIIFIFIITLIPIPINADRVNGSIELSATRSSIPADGKSTTTINAIIRDSDGKMTADDTEIQFTSSLGIIEDIGVSSSGVARVKLTSPEIEGTAVITATWLDGQTVAQMNIIFSGIESEESDSRYITIKSDRYLAYGVDKKIVDAIGNVKVKYKSITIEAYAVQIDLYNNRIIARGQGRLVPVKISSGDVTVEGEMFSCDTVSTNGLLLSSGKGITETVDFSKQQLTVKEYTGSFLPEMFEFFDLSESPVIIRSNEATVFPGEKIQFKKTAIYVAGKRMIGIPYYVLSLTGMQVDGDQYLGYSTNGISLNIPLYYSLTPTSSGALILKNGASSGWSGYGDVPGWFVDVRQNYATDNAQGSLVLNQVTDNEWGARYNHSQSFGNSTNANLYIDYPAHKDLFGSFNINKSFNAFSVGLDFDGSKDQYGGDSFSSNISVRTKSQRIGKTPFSYNFSGSQENSRISWESVDSAPVVTKTNARRINGNISSAPIPVVKNVKVRGSLGLGYVWQDSTVDTGDLYGMSTIGSAMMDWKISPSSNLQLNYRYVDKPAYSRTYKDGQTIVAKPARQSISANWRIGKQQKWYLSVYGIKGLDYPTLSVFGDLSYKIDDKWRFGVRATSNKYRTLVMENGLLVDKDRSYNDLELILGRKIGSQEVAAVWSKSQNRIMFELGSVGF